MPGPRDWVAKATTDLQSAKKLIKDDDETLHSAAYFTQQTAEKSLKAYLVFMEQKHQTGRGVPRTHDLEKLLQECTILNNSFGQLRSEIEGLSVYATYTRYPDDYFFIDREEALDAIKKAEKIFKFVKSQISPSENTPQMNLFDK